MELYTVNIILRKANMANVLSALQVLFMKDDIIVVFFYFVQLLFICITKLYDNLYRILQVCFIYNPSWFLAYIII